jgi:CPA2 family monovalent cation:H+ antiporter-2
VTDQIVDLDPVRISRGAHLCPFLRPGPHAGASRKRDVEYEIRETIESALLFGRKTLEGLGMERESTRSSIADDIRKRDEARLQLQAVDGLAAGRELMISKPMQPEPLIKPRKEAAE